MTARGVYQSKQAYEIFEILKNSLKVGLKEISEISQSIDVSDF